MSSPKLRFKEFSEDWKSQRLETFVEFHKGKNISKGDIVEDGLTECIRYGELYTSYNEVISNVISRTSLTSSDLFFSKVNDIIIPSSGETSIDIATASCVLKDNVALGGDLNVLRTEENGVFLSYYLNNQKRYDIAKLAQGNAVVHLYNSQLKNLDIKLPSKNEQEKIATFFTTVDLKLNLLKEKKEKLELYKKGVMQQIFSQKLRFKGFSDEWKSSKVENHYKNITTNSFSRSCLNYEDGKVKNIHYGDIHVKFQSHLDVSNEVLPYINEDSNYSRYPEESYCLEKDLVFADASEDLNDIGKCIEIVNTDNEKILCGLHTIHLRNTGEDFFKGFAGYLFRSEKVVKQIQRESQGAKVLGISSKKILNIYITYPSLPEQEKIAQFLSTLDAKINLVETQIQKTKLWKKGLLQQMFV